jgi:hypothetical protein
MAGSLVGIYPTTHSVWGMRVRSERPNALVLDRNSLGGVRHSQYVGFWPIATFPCVAEFGRYWGIANIEHAAMLSRASGAAVTTRMADRSRGTYTPGWWLAAALLGLGNRLLGLGFGLRLELGIADGLCQHLA